METKEFKTLRYNEAIVNGVFDVIKSALPTIGKAAMGAFKAVFGDSANGGVSSGCYKVSLGKNNNGEESMIQFAHEDGHLYAINPSLNESFTLNLPCKGKDLVGQQILLRPFSKIDVTEDFNNAAKYNATRFGLTASPTSYETQCSNGGSGIISCLGYFTKKMLDKPLCLNSHIIIEAIGNSLKVTLRGGLEVQYGQGLSIRQSDGGAEKNFSKVFATREVKDTVVTDGSDAYIMLDNALDDYEMEDDLMIIGDLVFVNVTGQRLQCRLS